MIGRCRRNHVSMTAANNKAQTFVLNKLVEVINNKLISAKGNLLAPKKGMQLCNVIKTENNKVRFLKKKEMNNKCFIEDAQSF